MQEMRIPHFLSDFFAHKKAPDAGVDSVGCESMRQHRCRQCTHSLGKVNRAATMPSRAACSASERLTKGHDGGRSSTEAQRSKVLERPEAAVTVANESANSPLRWPSANMRSNHRTRHRGRSHVLPASRTRNTFATATSSARSDRVRRRSLPRLTNFPTIARDISAFQAWRIKPRLRARDQRVTVRSSRTLCCETSQRCKVQTSDRYQHTRRAECCCRECVWSTGTCRT